MLRTTYYSYYQREFENSLHWLYLIEDCLDGDCEVALPAISKAQAMAERAFTQFHRHVLADEQCTCWYKHYQRLEYEIVRESRSGERLWAGNTFLAFAEQRAPGYWRASSVYSLLTDMLASRESGHLVPEAPNLLIDARTICDQWAYCLQWCSLMPVKS